MQITSTPPASEVGSFTVVWSSKAVVRGAWGSWCGMSSELRGLGQRVRALPNEADYCPCGDNLRCPLTSLYLECPDVERNTHDHNGVHELIILQVFITRYLVRCGVTYACAWRSKSLAVPWVSPCPLNAQRMLTRVAQ